MCPNRALDPDECGMLDGDPQPLPITPEFDPARQNILTECGMLESADQLDKNIPISTISTGKFGASVSTSSAGKFRACVLNSSERRL